MKSYLLIYALYDKRLVNSDYNLTKYVDHISMTCTVIVRKLLILRNLYFC